MVKTKEDDTRLVITTPQEKKFQILTQLAECNQVRTSITRSIFTISWRDIMHLFFPIRIYTEISTREYKVPELVFKQNETKEIEVVPGTRAKESLKGRPLRHANNTEGVRQVSLSLTPFVSHDATTELKELLNLREHEETLCLKPKRKNLELSSLKVKPPDQHLAKECLLNRLANDLPLEVKRTSFKDSRNFVEINISNASISHLFLPKEDESGTGVTREEVEPHPKLSESQAVRLEDKFFVEGSQRNELDHEYNKEPNNKWKPKEEQSIDLEMLELSTPTCLASKEVFIKVDSIHNLLCGTQVSGTQTLIQYWNNIVAIRNFKCYVFTIPISSIMHLILPLSAAKDTGVLDESKEVLGGALPEKNTSTKLLQKKNHLDKNVLDITKCKPPMKRIESVLNTLLIKEEPPDSYQSPGKYLDSQRRMKPNLLLVGTGQIVLRTKPSEGGGNDEDIGPNNYQDQAPKADGFTMPCPRAKRLRRGVYKTMELPIITKNGGHSRKNTPEEADIQGSSHDPGLDIIKDFTFLSITRESSTTRSASGVFIITLV